MSEIILKPSNPYDIQRLKELNKDVNLLRKHGFIRFTSQISEKLGINKGNLSSYLNGKKPISDSFFAAFKNAYANELAKINQVEGYYLHEGGATNYVNDREDPFVDLEEEIKQINNKLLKIEMSLEKLHRSMNTTPAKTKASPKKVVKKKRSKTKK